MSENDAFCRANVNEEVPSEPADSERPRRDTKKDYIRAGWWEKMEATGLYRWAMNHGMFEARER